MKSLVDILILLAAVSFVAGVFLKVLDTSLLGLIPLAYWRFTMGCLGFAIALSLRELAQRR